jgi:hypothetical protein
MKKLIGLAPLKNLGGRGLQWDETEGCLACSSPHALTRAAGYQKHVLRKAAQASVPSERAPHQLTCCPSTTSLVTPDPFTLLQPSRSYTSASAVVEQMYRHARLITKLFGAAYPSGAGASMPSQSRGAPRSVVPQSLPSGRHPRSSTGSPVMS